jgi:hypothetical protein
MRDTKHTGAHDPLLVFAYPHTAAGFLEFKILQQLDAVCELRVVLQTALPLPDQPVGQGSRCR